LIVIKGVKVGQVPTNLKEKEREMNKKGIERLVKGEAYLYIFMKF